MKRSYIKRKPRKRKKKTPKDLLKDEAEKLFKEVVLKRADFTDEYNGMDANVAHHFILRSQCSQLMYDSSNGIALSQGSHLQHHQAQNPRIHDTIIRKRGTKWADELYRKKDYYRDNLQSSYKNMDWYKTKIAQLKKELTKLL